MKLSNLCLLLPVQVVPSSWWMGLALLGWFMPSRFFVTGETNPATVPFSTSPPLLVDHEDDDNWRTLLPPILRNRTTLHRFYLYGQPLEPVPNDEFSSLNALSSSSEAQLQSKPQPCEVYLLGTAHVSASSCEDVKALIEHIRPDCLFLELCPQRVAILDEPPPPPTQVSTENSRKWSFIRPWRRSSTSTPPQPSFAERVHLTQSQNPGMSRSAAVSATLLSSVQLDFATKLNVTVGAEFREAYRAMSPRKGGRGTVVLGDRPARVTLQRAWESLRLWGRIQLVAGLLWSCVVQPSADELEKWIKSVLSEEEDVITKSITEMSVRFPTLARTIVYERDAYMHAKLCQLATVMGTEAKTTIVAVVGAGHCKGIRALAEGNRTVWNEAMEGTNFNTTLSTFPHSAPEETLYGLLTTRNDSPDTNPELRMHTTEVIQLETEN